MRSRAYVTFENIDRKSAAWVAAVRRSARQRPHLRPAVSRCALLVIDMVNYFARPGERAFLPASEAVLPNILRLVSLWRERGGTVVLTRHCHEGRHDLGMLGRFFSDHIRCGYPEADLVDALRPGTGSAEIVLRKTTYDAFHSTGLCELLRQRGCDQVLVAGVLTQMCCETTARSAFVRGFETFVAADATATTAERLHLASLRSMASCVAVVFGTREILDLCGKPGGTEEVEP